MYIYIYIYNRERDRETSACIQSFWFMYGLCLSMQCPKGCAKTTPLGAPKKDPTAESSQSADCFQWPFTGCKSAYHRVNVCITMESFTIFNGESMNHLYGHFQWLIHHCRSFTPAKSMKFAPSAARRHVPGIFGGVRSHVSRWPPSGIMKDQNHPQLSVRYHIKYMKYRSCPIKYMVFLWMISWVVVWKICSIYWDYWE